MIKEISSEIATILTTFFEKSIEDMYQIDSCKFLPLTNVLYIVTLNQKLFLMEVHKDDWRNK